MLTNHIPADWKFVLDEIQQKHPLAVIAGGSLRDLYYGKTPKDVDIFIPITSIENFNHQGLQDEVHRLDNNFGVKLFQGYGFSLRDSSRSDRLKTIQAVYGINYLGIAFDIIAILCDAEHVIDDFDMSINQIEFDGDLLHTTQAFHDTFNTHIITYVNRDERPREESRLKRIKDKFPDFEVKDEN